MIIIMAFYFIYLVNSYELNCYPVGYNQSEGFRSENGVNCDQNTQLNISICFNHDFTFTTLFSCGLLVFSSPNEITIYSNNWINALQLFYITENTSVVFNGYFHSDQDLIVEENATIQVFGQFSIGYDLTIENPQLDKPPIVLWQSDRLHLYRNNKNFDIRNPINNLNCFDVLSMSNTSCLNFDNYSTHLTTLDFPHVFKEGVASLLSNGKLMRFCPIKTIFNNTVTCTLNQYNYQTEYNGNKNYVFDYPHCPCDDSKTNCYLYLNQNISNFNFQLVEMPDTILVIEKSVDITNADIIKEIQINDDICVNITSLYKDEIIQFSFGTLTVIEGITQKSYSLNFNSTTHTLSISQNLNLKVEISSQITEIKLDVEGIIDNIVLNVKCFVTFGKKVEKVHQLTHNDILKTNDVVVLYFENETIENSMNSNCILMESFMSKTVCIKCNSNTRLVDGMCVGLSLNCKTFNSENYCVECENGYLMSADNKCIQSYNYCNIGNEDVCIRCENGYFIDNGRCTTNENCKATNGANCIKCHNGELNTNCDTCSDVNCITCENNRCIICNDGYYIQNDGNCFQTKTESNYVYNNIIYCKNGYYIDNSECKNCSIRNTNWMKCDVEKPMKCSTTYKITESGSCESTTCKDNEEMEQNGRCSATQDNCVFTLNNKCLECFNNYMIDDNGNCIQNSGDNAQYKCKETTQHGCVRCNDKYYLLNGNCVSCDGKCDTCISTSTFCLSCKDGMFLSDHKCITNNDLDGICTQFIPSGGCVKCVDGYYRSELSCERCDVKCGTCNNRESCLTCNLTNYRTSNDECKPQSDIVGCRLETTQNGCAKCSDGYFTVNTNECEKCSKTCATCSQTTDTCTSCDTNEVLVDSQCVDISSITNCKEVGYSKCTKCSFWHTPSANGTFCKIKAVWWMIIVIVVVCILLIILITTILFIIIKIVIKNIIMKKREKTTTLFNIKMSNITFTSLQGGVCINKTELIFNTKCDEIPVGKESCELLCVGNTTSKTLKIQISSKSDEESYQLRIDPNIVILKKGVACEFSIYLTPNYSSNITSQITLISKNLSSGVDTYNTVNMTAKTMMSSKLDYHEIVEDKKLGEGSFGVVYKGSYRGNVVAIKKMKQFNFDDESIEEFEKEVDMLDKFRSEYIVHFYGAVFIPNKVCMVTEFAQFGSCQDLMKHKSSSEIDMKIRIKITKGAANGILYLHENGILHRDIKPDNILVFSLNSRDKVNAKLTDFGSARNINMMMTNMTFTKGIGTPIYMAPEVLKQEKYKKEADIYSFAVTMYEVFGWCEIYPKNIFKYSWKIAEFVTAGKRVENVNNIPNSLFEIIQNCWKQNPKERTDIQTVSQSINVVSSQTLSF
ncbi:protein serine/threonine kinase, putative [Entamoeba invadens IP1]|uniref:Protein serine/threonine kinase, putative n=1 Tax=Entamoeba invadens IP1 TaxID=370355 RepID=A0A0A1UA13_ENTIV|nr:protein serine/threonine kinase, putative [Entamoeba invadens IP1]ELP91817.1 protein serine/threonine kinase, putative [Entamoeba invadens IP1]|eukprot:XP_004258588.1 protein serine/threonine kinase, putative [Entamoeba invadens IP1]